MKRCKKRMPGPGNERWRCVGALDHPAGCAYQPVGVIRLPKSQMELLRSLREQLHNNEHWLARHAAHDEELLVTLQTREALHKAISELEEWGVILAEKHVDRIYRDRHWGHDFCTTETCAEHK